MPADWTVVVGLTRALDLPNPHERCIFIATEPPEVMLYDRRCLSHYGTVVAGQFRYLRSLPVLRVHTGLLPWRVGVAIEQESPEITMTRNDFLALPPAADRSLSVVTSDKSFTSAQVKRLRLIEYLSKRIPEIKVYGRSFRLVSDKADPLRLSQFHLALENCRQSRFWTEKLSDPILMGAVTLYSGGNGWRVDFPTTRAIVEIDVDHPTRAYDQVRKILDTFSYDQHLEDLRANRREILERLNLHAVIDKVVNAHSLHMRSSGTTRVPRHRLGLLRNWAARMR